MTRVLKSLAKRLLNPLVLLASLNELAIRNSQVLIVLGKNLVSMLLFHDFAFSGCIFFGQIGVCDLKLFDRLAKRSYFVLARHGLAPMRLHNHSKSVLDLVFRFVWREVPRLVPRVRSTTILYNSISHLKLKKMSRQSQIPLYSCQD